MINDIIGNKTLIPILKRILDLGAVRHRVIAQNIANASTNGYRKKSVDFEESLQSLLQMHRERSMREAGDFEGMENAAVVDFKIVESSKKPDAGAPNNVNINEEMADLARNHLYYKFAVNMMKRQFAGLKSSITGRVG